MSDLFSSVDDSTPLLTVGHIRSAEEELRQAEAEVEDAKRRLQSLIEAAEGKQERVRRLHALISELGIAVRPNEPASLVVSKTISENAPACKLRMVRPTWTSTLLSIVRRSDTFLSYGELRERAQKSALMSFKKWSEKSFHGAMSKLSEQGLIVKYREHVFTPQAYAEHIAAVEAGEREDVTPASSWRGSAMGDEICNFLSKHGSSFGREITNYLRGHPDFQEALAKGTNGAYNVIKRYVDAGIIAKDETLKKYWLVEPVKEFGLIREDRPDNQQEAGTSC